jgi:hypothetical protein
MAWLAFGSPMCLDGRRRRRRGARLRSRARDRDRIFMLVDSSGGVSAAHDAATRRSRASGSKKLQVRAVA